MTALPKHTHARVEGITGSRILKVLAIDEADSCTLPPDRVLLWDGDAQEGACGPVTVTEPKDARVIRPGDVVRLRENGSLVSILYRRGANANVLFTTERCDSLCLMCSQPPRDEDDEWRLGELLELVPLIDVDERHLGITGGEPTLLGRGLTGLLEACRLHLPQTHLQVLTNGRGFRDADLASQWVRAGGADTVWATPLYADSSDRHDEIVGAPGAHGETLRGLAEMARLGARVEIRVVLHALSLPRLRQLMEFVYRRLPFVEHVALMGLEPMGLAKRNRDRLWLDPVDYAADLAAAVDFLADRGMAVSIYNLPLCVLPRGLWAFARRSISDWKNSFAPECAGCAVQPQCAGFFSSAGPAWRSRAISPLAAEEAFA